MTPAVLSIAGFDPSGGAGLIADIETVAALGGHCSGIVTATTAQSMHHFVAANPTPASIVAMQLSALHASTKPAKAIKLGMLGSADNAKVITNFLVNQAKDCFVVVDPVLATSSGGKLGDSALIASYLEHLIRRADLITPNLPEASAILGKSIINCDDMDRAALDFIGLGAKAVLIKGGHLSSQNAMLESNAMQGLEDNCHGNNTTNSQHLSSQIPPRPQLVFDRYRDQRGHTFWLTSPRLPQTARGTGCVLSTAIAYALASGQDPIDSIVMARAYIHRALRLSCDSRLKHTNWPVSAEDFPWLAPEITQLQRPLVFASTGPQALGLYPIVDRAAWLPRLCTISISGQRISTAQLRIKDLTGSALEQEVATAIAYAKQHRIRLFINDYWQLAIRMQAYGVHLGQEDLATADLAAIAEAGLRLGLSTHSYAELARANSIVPSYVALGPIYPTSCKAMRFGPQGPRRIHEWQQLCRVPLVAIGGLRHQDAQQIKALGADGIAVISDIMHASNPEDRVRQWLMEII